MPIPAITACPRVSYMCDPKPTLITTKNFTKLVQFCSSTSRLVSASGQTVEVNAKEVAINGKQRRITKPSFRRQHHCLSVSKWGDGSASRSLKDPKMVCVIFFSGLDRQDGTSNQVLFSEDCQKPRLMMSSQQYRNISSSNIWSNHDISPEICCGSKWWLSPLNLRLRWSMSLTEHPNPIISVSAAHCMLALTTSQILCWQVSLRLLGKWMIHDVTLTITHHSILCWETLSYPNCFVESLAHSPKPTTGGNV